MNRSIRLAVAAATTSAFTSVLALSAAPAAMPVAAAGAAIATLPTDNPANFTPNVMDGQVNAIWQVGNRVIVGGTFTQIANSTSNGGTVYDQKYLAAFDATTGVVDTNFDPIMSGEVEAILPGPDNASVIVGGDFNTVNLANRRKVARVRLADGELTTFNARGPNGLVRDLRLSPDKSTLYVAGLFTSINGTPREYLASLDPTSGTLTNDVDLDFEGLHNGGTGKVIKMELTPSGDRMLITGNFTSIEGNARDQVALVDLSTTPATVSPWATTFYTSVCAAVFDSYTRDLDISDDGTYAIVATTGAYRANTSCDTVARLEIDNETSGITPTWINYTGGDTSYSVEIHDGVAFIGGHMRWFNNPFSSNVHGAGGVSRPGMGALDVETGVPFSWNPTRERGVGLFDYHVTEQGIWAGSDTERWNQELRRRLAFFPWSGGTSVPPNELPTLPGDVVRLGNPSGALAPTDGKVLYRVNAGGAALASVDDGPEWAVDTSGAASTLHNLGSATFNASGNLAVPEWDATVPNSDLDRPPAALWTTERYDPAGGNEMQWDFPVANGTQIVVRLYLSNRCTCTDAVGERIFSVNIDGNAAITDLDLTQTVGHDVGTMRSFAITSDGNVDIDFIHGIADNPLVNGIEIIEPTGTTGSTVGQQDSVTTINLDGTPLVQTNVPNTTIPFRTVRGAFAVNATLYTFHVDGSIVRRTYDGTTFGAGSAVDSWSNTLMTDQATMTGLFFDPATRRIYYTMAGQSLLFSRPFNVESGIADAVRSSAPAAAINPSNVSGMFLGGDGKLYFVEDSTGDLKSVTWANGAPSGSASTVNSTIDWDTGRALFVAPTVGANSLPVAVISLVGGTCTDNVCEFDGTGSTDPDTGDTLSYLWDFGDGSTSTSATTSHSYAVGGDYTVTLTVTDDKGGSDEAQTLVSPGDPPSTAPTAVIATPSCSVNVCDFDGTGSTDDGVIDSYVWHFGDATTADGATASHAYGAAGTYDVELTVTDDTGLSHTAHASVTVSAPVVSAPAAPGTPAATTGVLSATVTWTAPPEILTAPVTKYVVTATPGGTTCTTQGTLSCVVTGLTPGTSYTFKVKATNRIGTSPASAASNAVVPTSPPKMVPLVPARYLETRNGPTNTTFDGVSEGIGVRAAGSVTKLTVAGRGSVPANASAVMLNMTAILPQGAGFLTVYPCGTARPVASNLNYTAGQVVANAVLAKIGTNGQICIYTKAATDMVVDVTGQVPAGGSPYTLTPARLLDTRAGQSTVDGQFQAGGARGAGSTLQLTVAGRGGVPADAEAVMLNVTAVLPVGPGFLTVFPCGTTRPVASTVNYAVGQVVPNAVLAKVGANGKVCIYTKAATDVLVDVGAYVPRGGSPDTVTPARLLETRPGFTTVDGKFQGVGVIGAGTTLPLTVSGRGGVPTGATAVMLNVTAVNPAAAGYLIVFPCGTTRPVASSVNFAAGQVVPNAVFSKVGTGGQVCIYAKATTDVLVDVTAAS